MGDLATYKRFTCVHFTGIQHDACAAGVPYASVRDASQPGPYCWPCLPGIGGKVCATTCDKKRLPTLEELEAEEQKWKAAFAAITAGLSPCCNAPLDESHVRGGTGPRFCSKCKTFVFRACATTGDEP